MFEMKQKVRVINDSRMNAYANQVGKVVDMRAFGDKPNKYRVKFHGPLSHTAIIWFLANELIAV